MKIDFDDYIEHYGVARRSGRYPWGSSGWGEGPGGKTQSEAKSWLDYISDMMVKLGLKEPELAAALGISTTELRAAKSKAKAEYKQEQIGIAQKLKDKGYSNVAIGKSMGLNESSVRALLAPGAKDKSDILEATSSMLRDQVGEKGFIDVGKGVENHVGISREKLRTAVSLLEDEGYVVHRIKIKQLGTDEETTLKVLCPPGTTYSEVMQNKFNIQQIMSYSDDSGRTFLGIKPPLAIDQSRVGINYAEDGGTEADGVIYVRPGVEDISLGGNTYAQVRIQVGDGHYLKGMAVYKDDLPDGVDLLFNTNKSNTGNKLDAMKPLKDDPDNPFGAVISRQILSKDATEEVTSVMNIVNEEQDWAKWSKSLSTQVLSKQSPVLAKNQLDITYSQKMEEFDEIMRLTDPVVREKLLYEFSDGVDAASVHLKAAALPRQAAHVIMPVSSLSDSEIYAPNYNNGEEVALIRYPHGGIFEIPVLKVNNKHPEAKGLLGNAPTAVGINAKVASQLSGADFDGDTVLVVPRPASGVKRLKVKSPLEDLKGFDPQAEYPGYDGMKRMTNTQTEMGKISNLITDMTIRGASDEKIARAVKHSMVVIDAEKHGLNYKQSEINNGIKALREEFQSNLDGTPGGASTIVSRAKGRVYIPEVKPRPAKDGGPIDKETGERVFVTTDRTNYKGKPVTIRKENLSVVKDARELSSGTTIENVYADHSNKLKALANRARKEAVNTVYKKYNPAMKKAYADQVKSLDAKLEIALRNAPLERQAQVIANSRVEAKRKANPNMSRDDLKKIKSQALEQARRTTGASKQRIEIQPTEWEAIQAGAVSPTKLKSILDNANMDIVKELATPRTTVLMTAAKQNRATAMFNAGYTRAEVAAALGVSVSTLDRSVQGSEATGGGE